MTEKFLNESNEDLDTVIRLNVGGVIYQTRRSTLTRDPEGRLKNLNVKDPAYNPVTGEYFFDQDGVFFQHVLQFYRSGELHIPSQVCYKTINQELDYWGLNSNRIADCCWIKYCKAKEQYLSQVKLSGHMTVFGRSQTNPKRDESLSIKETIWRFIDVPTSSVAAKIWTVLSVTLLLISISCYALSTLPVSKRMYPLRKGNSSWSEAEVEFSRDFLSTITIVDVFCLSFFTIEFILRVFTVPRKSSLLKSFLFYCDILFLLPGWMLDITVLYDQDVLVAIATYNKLAVVIVQVLTVTRLFRIFRLAWYFQGIRILLYVLKASIRELLLLGIFLCIFILFYGFLIYTAEVSVNEKFENAFYGFWWAIVTMSTVGYGDLVPTTVGGYIIAGLCAISGLVILGMPIPIIVSNFDLYYGFRVRENPNKGNTSVKSAEVNVMAERYTIRES